MRKITSMLLSATAAITLFPSCAGLRRAAREPVEINVNAETPQLESASSPVIVKFDAVMPERYRNVNTGILFEPVLVNAEGTDSVSLRNAIAEGRFHNMYDRRTVRFKEQPKDNDTGLFPYIKYDDTGISWEASTPYQEWMGSSIVKVRIYAEAYGKQVLLKETCIPVQILVKEPEAQAEPVSVKTEPEEEIDSQMQFRMQFPLDSDDLSGAPDAKLLKDRLKELLSDKKATGYRISITVSNSPEGSSEHNAELCARRRDAIIRLIGEAGADTGKCDVVMIPENWDGLIEKAAGLIPDSVKGLQKAVYSIDDTDRRESYIRKNMSIDWIILSKIVCPELRYCYVTIKNQ